MVLVMTFTFAACGTQEETAETAANTIAATLVIDYPDELEGVTFTDVEDELALAEGTNALDALKDYCKEKGIIYSYDNANNYVNNIGGAAATSTGGWGYYVNGEMLMDVAENYIIKDGDEIEWEYMSFE